MSDPQTDQVEPIADQPKLGTARDQSLSIDEKQFYGLYIGTRLPSGVSGINDTRIFPKCARILWHNIVQFDRLEPKLVGLLDLVKYGGAPLAEDINDITIIHDDPRKALHKQLLYLEHVKRMLSMKISLPFHTYYIDSENMRSFLYTKRIPVSISSRSNNTLSIHKDGFLIDGDKLNIILAASGSGKSHFVDKYNMFKDADPLLKWPDKSIDWLSNLKDIHDVNVGLWQQMAELPTSHILLYNGDMTAIPKYLEHKFRFLALVEVPWERHEENLKIRRRMGSRQHHDPIKALVNRGQLREFAIKKGIPIYSGFISAMATYTREIHKYVSEAVQAGQSILNITETSLRLVSKGGVFVVPNKLSTELSFGSHISMRIHTNEYARYSGLTQHRWRHLTRYLPQYYILMMLGFKPTIEKTICGNIGAIKLFGDEITPSGHMLGAFTWLAFPDARLSGMPLMYPDFHTYLTMYMLNQRQRTPSLEPFIPEIAYHRWVETLAGIMGSYYAIKILLKKGLTISRRNAILWRLYARRAIRSIIINDRTWYFKTKFNRDDDARFGPL